MHVPQHSWVPDPLRFDQGHTYLEIDLLKKSDNRKSGFKISGIATQGDEGLQAWVTQYQISYTLKTFTTDDSDWKKVNDINGGNRTFAGNEDAESVVTNLFGSSATITAKRVRIYPISNGFNSRVGNRNLSI